MPSSDEEWTKVSHEYGNNEIDTLVQHFVQNKRSQRFKLIAGQELLSKIDPAQSRNSLAKSILHIFKEILFPGNEEDHVKR